MNIKQELTEIHGALKTLELEQTQAMIDAHEAVIKYKGAVRDFETYRASYVKEITWKALGTNDKERGYLIEKHFEPILDANTTLELIKLGKESHAESIRREVSSLKARATLLLGLEQIG